LTALLDTRREETTAEQLAAQPLEIEEDHGEIEEDREGLQ
jgi:hypothetical protein